MTKLRFLLTCLLSFNLSAHECRDLSVEEEWDTAEKIFYGRVLEGKYHLEKGMQFIVFKVKPSIVYKGKVEKNESIISVYGYTSLRVGDNAIIFIQADKTIETCGNSQPIERDLLSQESLDRADLDSKFKNLLIKLLNSSGVSPNK